MPNTYTQLHIHLVFAVKHRASLIDAGWKERLHQYISGIFQQNGHKVLQINSMPDHVHIFIGQNPAQALSSIVKNVKAESSKWIKANSFCRGQFAWQEGYGAFSYAKSQVPDVIRYIQEQEEHHKKQTFVDEYRKILSAFDIAWDEQYIFQDPQ